MRSITPAVPPVAQVSQATLQVLRIVLHRHRVYPGRRRSSQPPERSLERSYVHVVQQRSESGLPRPAGRIVHPQQVRRQACPVLPPLRRAPLPSGPSLPTARCLRRHLRYYAPIRHPNAHETTAAIFPRRWSPAVTCCRAHPGFPGSDDILAYMMWSMTPALPDGARLRAPPGVAFGHGDGLGSRDFTISWLHTHPARSLSTLRHARCRHATQDSLRGAWLDRSSPGIWGLDRG